MKKLILLFGAVLLSLSVKAQVDELPKSLLEDTGDMVIDDSSLLEKETNRIRKYPARLWMITGNGLKKPSYLYGTMHVSSKFAFNLGDTFYKAIGDVDVVALELAIDSWFSNIGKRSGSNSEGGFGFNDMYGNRYGRQQNQYKLAGEFEAKEISAIMNEISSKDYMSNFLLYRQGWGNGDYNEKTYVDMYIHQAGKKLNKFCTGLEDFKISDEMVSRSDWRERTMKKPTYNYGGYDRDQVENAYKEGDLDLIDSLDKKVRTSNMDGRWMLDQRNIVMANEIERITKTKSLFAAVGCAHLPGDTGVIDLLRRKGYTLTPVRDKVGSYAFDQKLNLEKNSYPINLKKFNSNSGELEFELPGAPIIRSTGVNNEEIFYADVSNGAYYVIKKLPYYGLITKTTQAKMLDNIDSALYENVPGDLTEKSRIMVNGYPALTAANKTKSGETQRHLFVVMPNHIWYAKLNAAGEYAFGKTGKDFIKSIKINELKKTWSAYAPECGGYKLEWPTSVISVRNTFDTSTDYKSHKDLEFIDKDKNFYFLRTVSMPSYNNYDRDTFHMHQIALNYAYYNKINLEKVEFVKLQGHDAMKAYFKDNKESKNLFWLLTADNGVFYQLGYLGKDKSEGNKLLNSFAYSDFKYKYKPVKGTDKRQNYSMMYTNWKEIEKQNADYEKEKKIAMREIKYPARRNPVEYYFTDSLMGENIQIPPIIFPTGETLSTYLNPASAFAPEKYSGYPEYYKIKPETAFPYSVIKHFKDSVEKLALKNKLKYARNTQNVKYKYDADSAEDKILDTFYWKDNCYVSEHISSTKGSSKISYNLRKFYKYHSVYFSTDYDRSRGLNPQIKEAINSLEYNPKTNILDSNQVADLMIDLLSAKDSIKIFKAQDYIYQIYQIPKKRNDTLFSLMKKLKPNKEYGKDFAEKIEQKLVGDNYAKLQNYYIEKFYKNMDTTEIQIDCLSNLARLKNKKAMDTMVSMLLDETPLKPQNSYSDYKFSSFFTEAYDTLKLWKDYYKRLLPLTRYDEYSSSIYNLGIRLMDSSMIDSTVFLGMAGDLALSFRDDLKRKNAKKSNEDYYDYYGSSSKKKYEVKDYSGLEFGGEQNLLFGSGNSYGYGSMYSDYYSDKSYGYGHLINMSDIDYPQLGGYYSDYPYRESNSRSSLETKAYILIKLYNSNAEVAKRMNKVFVLSNKYEKLQYITLFMKNKVSIPDSFFNFYLKKPDYRYGMVKLMEKYGYKNQIPKDFYKEDSFVKSFAYYTHWNSSDTIVFMGKKSSKIEKETGTLYFYKSRSKEKDYKNEDPEWTYNVIWIGKNDTLNKLEKPLYFKFDQKLNKKSTLKDLMNKESQLLEMWKHPLWVPMEPEEKEKRRSYDYMDY